MEADIDTACPHQRDGQPLEVKPCTRCGTFVCEDCQGAMLPLCSPCAKARTAAEKERERRLMLGYQWSLGAGMLPILFSLFFIKLPVLVLFGAALLGGLWGGASAGKRLITATLYCVPGLATSFGSMTAVLFYAGRGGTVTLSEMIIPGGVVAVMSFGLWALTRLAIERFERDPREYEKR